MGESDVWFLRRNNIMDYSLLLAISEPYVNDENAQFSRSGKSIDGQPFWRNFHGGMVSIPGAPELVDNALSILEEKSDACEVYMMAIVDILQQFTWKKKLEGALKKNKAQAKAVSALDAEIAANAISCVDANTYASRFLHFLCNHVMNGGNDRVADLQPVSARTCRRRRTNKPDTEDFPQLPSANFVIPDEIPASLSDSSGSVSSSTSSSSTSVGVNQSFKAGEIVEVFYKGKWWKSTIHGPGPKEGTYDVRY